MQPTLQMDAFVDGGPHAPEPASKNYIRWAAARTPELQREVPLKPAPKPDLQRWSDPNVGWGVVMAESAGDPPPILKKLISARKAPVFRFDKTSPHAFSALRDERGPLADIASSPYGNDKRSMPYYLLIYGSPVDVPWSLQYVLGMRHCVGRLDLDPPALENYINAVLTDFAGEPANPYRTVTWSVDHKSGITNLLRVKLADPLYELFQEDDERKATSAFLASDDAGRAATKQALSQELALRPGLIVTTSHGYASAAPNALSPDDKARQLGWLVDQNEALLDPEELLQSWQPGGAIWYAHACCSAGSDAQTVFDGLFADATPAQKLLQGVADLGARTAPFPKTLLGAKNPARAFIGHVEPTFNWTVAHPNTQQSLTGPLIEAIVDLNRGTPVGRAFLERVAQAGSLLSSHDRARSAYNQGAQNGDELLRLKLTALDIQSTVILGDPAAALPIRP